jgi:hypothetical protein
MRFVTAAFIAIAAMVAAPYVASDSQMSMEAALALAAKGGSAHTYSHEYTRQTSTETVRTIETHIEIDVKVVEVERTTVEVKESWLESWKESGKSEMDATYRLYVKERDQAHSNMFAARRRILEGRITIAIHIHRWGSSIHSKYVTDMQSLHEDVVTFNSDVEKFFITLGHGVVKIGEVVLGTLVFAGVEAWHFGGKVVHTAEDAWNALAADAKSIWISFGLHLELFWSTVRSSVVTTYNNAKNGIDEFETNTSNKIHAAAQAWNHPNVGAQPCNCPPTDCSSAAPAQADSMEEDSSAPEHHRRQHKGGNNVRVEVELN